MQSIITGLSKNNFSSEEENGYLYSVEWNGGMEWWNGAVEWNSGMEWWNSGMTTPIERIL